MTRAFWSVGWIFSGILLVSPLVHGETKRLYSWDDNKGIKNFSSQPPKEDVDPVGEWLANPSGTMKPVPSDNRLLVKPKPVTESAPLSKQQESCAYYRSVLAKYQMQGVYAVDPATGKSERLKGESAEQTMASAKEAVRIFCSK
ncbi:MAG: hypothetical protein ACRCRW_10080 [Aeromonadaceae bacterium]